MDIYNIYSIEFDTYHYGSGVADAIGNNSTEAFNALKAQGKYNATPNEYVMRTAEIVGVSEVTVPTLVSEKYSGVEVIIGPQGPKGIQGDKGDKGDKGDDNTFIAIYNVTTYDKIVNEFSNEKNVICKYNTDLFALCEVNSDYIIFSKQTLSGSTIAKCSSYSVWGLDTVVFEKPFNKSQTNVNDSTKYPSSALLYAINAAIPVEKSIGANSIAQKGGNNRAFGELSHAEGYTTDAYGRRSHTEGYNTVANANNSHSEGYKTIANGQSSHTEGANTITNNDAEHASGKFNISHNGSAANLRTGFSHGIGSSGTVKEPDKNRKNALEIMQNGDIYAYNIGGYNGANPNTSGVKTLKQSIDEKAALSDVYTKTAADALLAAKASVSDLNTLGGRVTTIEGKIPAQATSANQLADKNFVNSSIATNTATFRGTFDCTGDGGAVTLAKVEGFPTTNVDVCGGLGYVFVAEGLVADPLSFKCSDAKGQLYQGVELVAESAYEGEPFSVTLSRAGASVELLVSLQTSPEGVEFWGIQISGADAKTINDAFVESDESIFSAISWNNDTGFAADKNDYAHIVVKDNLGNKSYARWKYTTGWAYEYTLNNSSFTANQWAAINSGITSGKVALIDTALQPAALTPYRTSANQDIIDAGKEAIANKTSDIAGNATSTTKYATTKGVADYVAAIVGSIGTILDEINGEEI